MLSRGSGGGRPRRRHGSVLAGIGAAVLAVAGQAEFIAAWVCLVVGAHFFPLRRVFPGIGMAGLALAISVVGVAAAVVALVTPVLPSSVTGLGAGACLAGHAATLLIAVHGRRRQKVLPAVATG